MHNLCSRDEVFLPTLGFITLTASLSKPTAHTPTSSVALHGLVGQQQHRAHQVAHQDEGRPWSSGVERHDVVVVVALGAQLLLRRPLHKAAPGGGVWGWAAVSLSPGAGLPSAAPLTQVQCGEMACCGTCMSVCNYHIFMKDENRVST